MPLNPTRHWPEDQSPAVDPRPDTITLHPADRLEQFLATAADFFTNRETIPQP